MNDPSHWLILGIAFALWLASVAVFLLVVRRMLGSFLRVVEGWVQQAKDDGLSRLKEAKDAAHLTLEEMRAAYTRALKDALLDYVRTMDTFKVEARSEIQRAVVLANSMDEATRALRATVELNAQRVEQLSQRVDAMVRGRPEV